MQRGEFPQQFFSPLVLHHGGLENNAHDLISPRVLPRIEHAALAQTELLVVLRAGWNLEQRPGVDGGDADLGSEPRLGHRQRHGDENVVAFPHKQRMGFHVGGDVEVAGWRADGAGVALAGHAQTRAVARSGGDAHIHRFRVRQAAVAAAGGARILQPAFAVAAGAGEIELHVAGHLRYIAGTVALRAGDGAGFVAARAHAGRALLVAGDFDARPGPANDLPEADVEAVFEIGALLRLDVVLGLTSFAAAEELAEDVFERSAAASARACSATTAAAAAPRGFFLRVTEHFGKVEAAEIHVGMAPAGAASTRARARAGKSVLGIEADLIVHLAFFGLAQDVVGFLHILEAVFSGLVSRGEIGRILAGELPVGFADVLYRGTSRDAQRLVIIVFWR